MTTFLHLGGATYQSDCQCVCLFVCLCVGLVLTPRGGPGNIPDGWLNVSNNRLVGLIILRICNQLICKTTKEKLSTQVRRMKIEKRKKRRQSNYQIRPNYRVSQLVAPLQHKTRQVLLIIDRNMEQQPK